jgi:hypothetical protein
MEMLKVPNAKTLRVEDRRVGTYVPALSAEGNVKEKGRKQGDSYHRMKTCKQNKAELAHLANCCLPSLLVVMNKDRQ